MTTRHSQLSTLFTPDEPFTAASDWFLDRADRQYIDEQIRALQTQAVYSLRGQITTEVMLHSSSATGAVGDCVCSVAVHAVEDDPLLAVRYVTRAISASGQIGDAGLVLGVLVTPGIPGAFARIAIEGIVGSQITGLASIGSHGPVKLNTTTGRCQRTPGVAFASGDYPVGFLDSGGNLTLARGFVIP
jgi:hypothetical protein